MQSHEEIDLTFLAATTVLTSLIPKCPPAEACRDALKRMAGITITMCLRHTGFGADAERFLMNQFHTGQANQNSHRPQTQEQASVTYNGGTSSSVRPTPDFDEGFKSLFSDTEIAQLSPPSHLPPTFRVPPRRVGGSNTSHVHRRLASQWQQRLDTSQIDSALQDATPPLPPARENTQRQPAVAAETLPQDDFDDINTLLAYDGDFTLDPSLADPSQMDLDFAFGDEVDADAGAGVGVGLGTGEGAGWSENDVAVMMGGYFFGDGGGGVQ